MKDFIFGFLGIVGSLGIVQVMLSRDAEAITKCRFLCFELKRLLEELADYLTFPSRNSQNDLPRLKEVKKVIEQLYVEKEGLTFRCPLLNSCLEESLPLFDRLRKTDGNPSNSSHFVAAELLQAWGLGLTRPFKVSQLLGIEKFLYKSFVKRFFTRICDLCRRKQKGSMKKMEEG